MNSYLNIILLHQSNLIKLEFFYLQALRCFCFPFAIDTNEMFLQQIFHCLSEVNLIGIIVKRCKSLTSALLEVPVGLLCRLALSYGPCLDQFSACLSTDTASYIAEVLTDDNTRPLTVCDILSLLSHVTRACPDRSDVVSSIVLKCHNPNSKPPILYCLERSEMIRAKSCSLLGNLLRKQNQDLLSLLPISVKSNIFEALQKCLSENESSVRRSASFAFGNIAFTGSEDVNSRRENQELGHHLQKAVPMLTNLLNDPTPKTRSNVVLTLSNLSDWGSSLRETILDSNSVSRLLEVALHDSQPTVKQSAFVALRAFCTHSVLRKALHKLNAAKKISEFVNSGNYRNSNMPTSARYGFSPRISSARTRPSGSDSSMRTVLEHAKKLLNELESEE